MNDADKGYRQISIKTDIRMEGDEIKELDQAGWLVINGNSDKGYFEYSYEINERREQAAKGDKQ